MTRSVVLPDGRTLDLDYFVGWRPWLWRKPVADALAFLGDLAGKRVLEIGGRPGRMASLFAMRGAHVTVLDICDLSPAAAEAAKWGVGDRMRLIQTQGDFEPVRGETFDAVFTKSVLWSVEHLGTFLDELDARLATGGKVAFLENYRGGRLWMWLRRNLVHRGRFGYEHVYHGIRPEQIPLFRNRFEALVARRYCYFVWGIFGRKASA